MLKFVLIAATAAAALTVSPLPALAQDAPEGGMTVFGRSVNVSVRARVGPDYMGSDDYKVGPAGGVSLSLPGADQSFSAPDDGASLSLLGDDTLAVGVVGRLRSGRNTKDDLRGFDKIDWAGEAGAFVNWWPTTGLRTRAEARRGFGGHEGWVVDLGADAVRHDGPWTMSIGPRYRWADDEFAQTYFGVSAREAARSPLGVSAYDAEGGSSSAGVLADIEYRWRPGWRITADAEYRRLLGDAADSPLVSKLGSEDQFIASVGVRYTLGS